jgi:hypothetical protein
MPMPNELTDEVLDFLLARAGIAASAEQRAELKGIYEKLAAMTERVRKPRGIMAEPAHSFGFGEEDLP